MRGFTRTAAHFAMWPVRFGLAGESRSSKIARRTWLVVFLTVFVLLPLAWLCLLARYHLSGPANQYRLIDQYNNDTDQIPEADRAWPLYARALTELREAGLVEDVPITENDRVGVRASMPLPGIDYRSEPAQVSAARRQLQRRVAPQIALVIAGTRKPHLAMPLTQEIEDYCDANPELRSLPFPLPHRCSELNLLFRLLELEIEAATANEKPERVLEAARAMGALIEQLEDFDLPITSYRTFRPRKTIVTKLTTALIEKPEIWNEIQLASVRKIVRQDDRRDLSTERFRRLSNNLLDQMYASSGQFRAYGVGLVRDRIGQNLVNGQYINISHRHWGWIRPRYAGRDRIKQEVESFLVMPVASQFLPSRDELSAQVDEALREREQLLERPSDEWPQLPDELQVDEWNAIPGVALTCTLKPQKPHIALRRDELYGECAVLLTELVPTRQQAGVWPETLADISPDLIPRDPFAPERPLRYEVRNGIPYLWSVSSDRVDQNGDKLVWYPFGGPVDWRLVPHLEGRTETRE